MWAQARPGEVLMLGGDAPKIGAPLVQQCLDSVARRSGHGQGEKGHRLQEEAPQRTLTASAVIRQHFTKVKVLGITAG